MRVPLISGAYQAMGLIANSQRQVNLYSESNPQDAPAPFTLYPTPGLTPFASPPSLAAGRGIYTASTGDVYAVIGSTLYRVSSSGGLTSLMTVSTGSGPVSWVDNGISLVIGDGSGSGWIYSLETGINFGVITDPNFFGFNKAGFLDTFIIFNKPGTPQMYVSPSELSADVYTPFNPLYFADMSTFPNNLIAVVVFNREIWLIGEFGTEFWMNSGASDFPFQLLPSTAIEYGCVAVYSVALVAESVLWLSQDKTGSLILLRGAGYQAKRVSNHAIEQIWSTYATVSDAVAWGMQFKGHSWYVLTFPTQNVTWVYDLATNQWFQWAWFNGGTVSNDRHRCTFGTAGYGMVLGLDWQLGNIYIVDPESFIDNTNIAGLNIIQRIKSFPHLPQTGKRIRYDQFTADMQALASDSAPISLFLSQDRGANFTFVSNQDLGADSTRTQLCWRRLGVARDAVFELRWTANDFTALNGAFVDLTECGT
jgi:hypothetical protein